ncbi:sigma-E processing peptidase SpoIIGA [Bacillus tianshenii]|nr:sigma-E processing peptidase SpoIIGA [Bacillus tianshenii]
MVVYLDIIWLLNFCIDLSLLALTAIVLKRRVSRWRLVLGAFVASLTVVLYFTPLSFFAVHPLGKFLFSFLIIFMAFGYRKFRFFMQGLLTFYVLTFMIGGGIVGMHYFLQVEHDVINGVVTTQAGGYGSPAGWLFVLISFPFLWMLSKNQFTSIETRKLHTESLAGVEIDIGHTILFMKGLIDSGNKLYDPLTKTPVMILDIEHAESQIPEAVFQLAKQPDKIGELDVPTNWQQRLRMIPFSGLGSANQLLLAVKPDSVILTLEHEQIQVKRVLIGLHAGALSSEGDFECILHPDMISNGQPILTEQAK